MRDHEFNLALVTGASKGIGRELAKLLAAKQINLILHGRDERDLSSLTEELKEQVNISVILADLNLPEERAKLVAAIREKKPDLVINNAGFGLSGDLFNFTTEEQLEIVKVDVEALLELSIEAAKTMFSSGQKGVIMNISSIAAFFTFPGFAVYAASKSFVTRFSEAFDLEMRPFGISVLNACPGSVDTNFFRTSTKEKKPNLSTRRKKSSFSPKKMSVTFAAEQILWQIDKKKPTYVFDWRFRALLYLSYFIPKRLLKQMIHRQMKRYVPK